LFLFLFLTLFLFFPDHLIPPISKGKRHLLRLWVSLNTPQESWSLFVDKQVDLLRCLKEFFVAKVVERKKYSSGM
jgi:hypothetical protein